MVNKNIKTAVLKIAIAATVVITIIICYLLQSKKNLSQTNDVKKCYAEFRDALMKSEHEKAWLCMSATAKSKLFQENIATMFSFITNKNMEVTENGCVKFRKGLAVLYPQAPPEIGSFGFEIKMENGSWKITENYFTIQH